MHATAHDTTWRLIVDAPVAPASDQPVRCGIVSHPSYEGDGRAMARRLAAEEGLLAGTSTDLDVTAAIELAVELGPGKTVVTVACDTGLEYLAGDLYTA